MKNQRTNCRSFQPIKFIALLAMLLVVTCIGGVIAVSGAQGPVVDAELLGLTYDEDAYCWVKTYDGQTDFDPAGVQIEGAVVTSVKATTVDATTGTAPNAAIEVEYTKNGEAQPAIRLPLRIEPKKLEWSATDVTTDPIEYQPDEIEYNTTVTLPADLKLNGAIAGDTITFAPTVNVSFSAVDIPADKTVYVQVAVSGAENYIVPLLPVKLNVAPITLTDIQWKKNDSYVFDADTDGNNKVDALEVSASALISGTNVRIELPVYLYNEEGTTPAEKYVPLAEAYEQALYGNVKKDYTNGTPYHLVAGTPNELYSFEDPTDSKINQTVKITQKVFEVALPAGEFLTQVDLSDPNKVTPLRYQLVVQNVGEDPIPEEFLKNIQYSYINDATGEVVSNGVDKPGNYTVVATFPSFATDAFENYRFNVETLSATLIVKHNYLVVGTADDPCQMIIVGQNGLNSNVKPQILPTDPIDRKAIYGYHIHKDYTIQIEGFGAENLKLILPIASIMAEDPNCDPLTVNDLYLYDGIGNMAPAGDKYTVTLSENGAYYIIEGFNTESPVTFIIAPGYEAPFWVTAPGIATIILIVLLVLLILFLAGLKLRQIERSDANNKVLVIDTEGDVPTFDPVVIPDKIEDPDAILVESIDDLADALHDDVAPAVEETEIEVNAEDAVAEARAEINEEIAAVDLTADREAEVAEATELTENMADALANELKETVPAEDGVGDISEEVNAAVAEAMAENFNESADATDAVELEEVAPEAAEEAVPVVAVAADSDDDDNDDDNDDDDDEGDSFGAYGSMPLNFIDAVAEAEKYNEMLAQESRGEVQLVTRYRRSYQSRLSQAQGNVQDYYNVVKNLLLSYKGVKNRISWNYETFNVGRTPVAKFNAKTRTLYIYIALSPEELADTKYTFNDMSSKKKYAAVPVLMKVKGDRKFKHAIELITMVCEEKLQLPKKKVVEENDYKIPYMTTEALVAEGMVKKLVAAIPLVDLPVEEPVEEAPVETEAPIEEAPVEEASAEEIPAVETVETETTEA